MCTVHGGVVAIAIVAGIVLVRAGAVDPTRLWAAFQGVRPGALVLAVVGAMGVVGFQSLRWWAVTRPVIELRYRDAFAAILVGDFFNVVLPARAGDALRVDDLSRRAGASRATLLGTELVDFVLDKAGWLPAFAILLVTGTPSTWLYRAALLMAGAVAVAVAAGTAARRAGGFPGLAPAWVAPLRAGLTANSPKRLALVALTLAACPWLWEAVVVSRFAGESGLHLGLLQAFAVLTAFNIATVVPMPGNVGAHEAASSAALVSFGVPFERAVAVALAYHATQIVTYVVVGGLLFLLRGLAGSQRSTAARTVRAAEVR